MPMMKKIKLNDFLENFNTILNYSKKHIINEDWKEWSDTELVDSVWDEMEYYVIALSKCFEYFDILENYDKSHNKKENIFLDD